PPCNRRHPRFPARLPAWIQHPGGEAGLQRLAAETVNVSHAGLTLALPEAPAPGTALDLQVETPFGLVEAEGRLAWTEVQPHRTWAGVTLQRLQTAQDALRWEQFIGSLEERVIHSPDARRSRMLPPTPPPQRGAGMRGSGSSPPRGASRRDRTERDSPPRKGSTS
ncbi:MAG: PilZ domain-containing protein, partial [candidate division NC10 bacterium]|nr:PilZ domain-containing protein [candidate division NC10 bacterium]